MYDLTACDFYGNLPVSRGGVQYIFVIIECWSKYVKLFPVKKANTETVIKCFENYFEDIGKPKRVLTDNGSQFISYEFKNFLKEHEVKHVLISKYNPKSNPSERVMKELGRLCQTYCSEKHTLWAKLITEFQSILNEIPHLSTGMSPTEILGRKFIGEPLLKYFDWPPTEKVTNMNIQSDVERNLTKAGEHRLRKLNKDASLPGYTIGDLVLIKTHNQSSNLKKQTHKFFQRWEGPYVISDIPHPKAVFLKNVHDDGEKGLYNVDTIKPYIDPLGH